MGLTNEVVKLRGQARKAGIEDYGSMSAAELRIALKGAGSSSKPSSKRKTRKSVTAIASTAAKRVTRKSASAKKTPAAKSPARGEAKRSSSGGSTRKSVTPASSNGKPGRNLIDRKQIDWTLDWAGGTKGNRGIIFKALRKHRGNYEKVYAALKADARKMFPKNTKTGERYSADKSRAQLKWYIGRTAFDYVTATKQHQKSTNRKPDRRTEGNSTGARKSGGSSRARSTPTRKTATAQRSSGTRKTASPRKRSGTAKRKTVKR